MLLHCLTGHELPGSAACQGRRRHPRSRRGSSAQLCRCRAEPPARPGPQRPGARPVMQPTLGQRLCQRLYTGAAFAGSHEPLSACKHVFMCILSITLCVTASCSNAEALRCALQLLHQCLKLPDQLLMKTLQCVMQAAAACPLQCTAQSPDGCAQRFQCAHGCPVCEQPPPSAACYGYRRVQLSALACSVHTDGLAQTALLCHISLQFCFITCACSFFPISHLPGRVAHWQRPHTALWVRSTAP